MSMIMRIARGSAADLERAAESGDDGLMPPIFGELFAKQQAAFAKMSPAQVAQLEAIFNAQPQLARLAPQMMAQLRGHNPFAVDNGSGGVAAAARAASPAPPTIDIHKSWHILHFLFSGQAMDGGTPPSNLLMAGGRETGEDLGYGPSRLLNPADTDAFAGFLGGLTVGALKARIDGPRMAELGIYCANDGGRSAVAEMEADVEAYFPELQAHFAAAAAAGEATLISLT